MQILPSEQHPPWNAEVICRQSRLISSAAILFYIGVFVGVPATLGFAGRLPNWLAVVIVVIAGIGLPLFLRSWLATMRVSNWTLAMGGDGIWLNLRSYSNYGLESGETVVYLPYRDLACAREVVTQRSTPTGDGLASWTERSLELRLQHPDSGQLGLAIDTERNRRTVTRWFGGFVTVSGRSNHVPITLTQADVIRIRWRSRHDFLRPGLEQVLGRMSIYTDVDEPTDDNHLESSRLTDSQLDARVLQLIEAGEKLDAIKLLKRQRGLTTTEAKKLVEALHSPARS